MISVVRSVTCNTITCNHYVFILSFNSLAIIVTAIYKQIYSGVKCRYFTLHTVPCLHYRDGCTLYDREGFFSNVIFNNTNIIYVYKLY